MAVANNADDYTVGRINIFFPANNQTPEDGNLTGQCVTLIKWFMAEMASVPSPFAARGDARYVGKNLVAQGLAVEVPYSQRKRGDIICYEYGTYGHIAVQLGGGNVFEENVNIGGVSKRVLADGTVVYASRIGNENESWRNSQHVYRLNSYVEGADMSELVDTPDEAAEIVRGVFKRDPVGTEVESMLGRYWKERIVYLRTSPAGQQIDAIVHNWGATQQQVSDLNKEVGELNTQLAALSGQPTADEVKAAQDKAATATDLANKLQAQVNDLQQQQAADTAVGNAFTRWIGGLFNAFRSGK